MWGSQLRERRTTLGLTQGEAADLAGLSERTVRALEQGKATAQLAGVLALADALGLELLLVRRGDEAGLASGGVPQGRSNDLAESSGRSRARRPGRASSGAPSAGGDDAAAE